MRQEFAAIDNATGSFPVPFAIDIIIGIIIEITAVFDVTSVSNSRRIIITNIMTKVDGVPKNATAVFAIKAASPVLKHPIR